MSGNLVQHLLLAATLCGMAASVQGADPFTRLSQTELGLGAYRSANGMPALNYWQQRVDYELDVQLLPKTAELQASGLIHYFNQSPDQLYHVYFLLDHNALQPGSAAQFRQLSNGPDRQAQILARAHARTGFDIQSLQRANGDPLDWSVRGTLLQVRLRDPLQPGEQLSIAARWKLPLADKVALRARSGYEELDDGQRIYFAAQWFPRAAAYTDYAGWQLKPFLQQGEFSTEFGNYRVRISAPENFTVAASGELTNARQVLNREQFEAWQSKSPSPQWLVSSTQAKRARKAGTSSSHKQWVFSGEQLRDFAFSASAAFQWQYKTDDRGRRLQLFFPAEGAPLWQRFGLDAVEHTLKAFDAATFALPYSSVSVVNTAGIGMEYPGLASIATRPERLESDGDIPPWDALTKYDFIGSIIHEVGHNYLPMVVNTDEREWAWLDEGLVSFIEYRAEHSWEYNFDVIYGEPRSIANYTASAQHQPIMSSADSLHKKIDNAYNKTASMLNTLRHLVLEPETFDHALRQFTRAWIGKRPTPGDFFRAIDSASGEDLSWFWRDWFFSAASIDLSIKAVSQDGQALSLFPVDQIEPQALAYTAGGISRFAVERDPKLADFYTQAAPQSEQAVSTPATFDLTASKQPRAPSTHWYQITIQNHGRGILPVPVRLQMANGSESILSVPAQTWQQADSGLLTLQLPLSATDQLSAICLDPLWLIPDTDRSNNCVAIREI